MNNGVNGEAAGEPSLIQLYMDLTGASEARARSVFMFVCGDHAAPGNGVRMDLAAELALGQGVARSALELPQTQTPRYKGFSEVAIPAISSA